MNKGLFIRIFVCILFFGGCLYSVIDMQNAITKLRIRIPELTQSVHRIEEENTRLFYEIEAFESPENLMKLASLNEFAYMKYPMNQEVVTLREAEPMLCKEESRIPKEKKQPTITFATGVKS